MKARLRVARPLELLSSDRAVVAPVQSEGLEPVCSSSCGCLLSIIETEIARWRQAHCWGCLDQTRGLWCTWKGAGLIHFLARCRSWQRSGTKVLSHPGQRTLLSAWNRLVELLSGFPENITRCVTSSASKAQCESGPKQMKACNYSPGSAGLWSGTTIMNEIFIHQSDWPIRKANILIPLWFAADKKQWKH